MGRKTRLVIGEKGTRSTYQIYHSGWRSAGQVVTFGRGKYVLLFARSQFQLNPNWSFVVKDSAHSRSMFREKLRLILKDSATGRSVACCTVSIRPLTSSKFHTHHLCSPYHCCVIILGRCQFQFMLAKHYFYLWSAAAGLMVNFVVSSSKDSSDEAAMYCF